MKKLFKTYFEVSNYFVFGKYMFNEKFLQLFLNFNSTKIQFLISGDYIIRTWKL